MQTHSVRLRVTSRHSLRLSRRCLALHEELLGLFVLLHLELNLLLFGVELVGFSNAQVV